MNLLKDHVFCVLLSSPLVNAKGEDNLFKLQPLPYAHNALEPYMSERTIEYHYGKHLATYIDKTNQLKKDTPYENMTIEEMVMETKGTLFNNAAQVFNHYFLFEALQAPNSEENQPKGKILEVINDTFGNFEGFKTKFAEASTSLFGSGYAWLVLNKDRKLEIVQTHNAECPLTDKKKPLLNLDVWEHAYYLDVQNARPKFVENFWHIVNWDVVNKRLECSCEES